MKIERIQKEKIETSFIYPRQEQGAVLIMALMLLIILTLLGISAIETTKLETRMAANTKEYNRTFQMAEVGISTLRKKYMSSPKEINQIPIKKVAPVVPDESSDPDDPNNNDPNSQDNSTANEPNTYQLIDFKKGVHFEGGKPFNGKVEFQITRSKTLIKKGSDTIPFFILESTGYNINNEGEAIQVQLHGGLVWDTQLK